MIETVGDWLEASRLASPWLGVVVLAALAVTVGVAPIVVGRLFRPRAPSPVKSSPYECGIEPVGDARGPVPVKFYVPAMIFLLLDVEAALLFPWAVAFGGSGFLLAAFVVFVGIVGVGYVWAWKKGAFEWA